MTDNSTYPQPQITHHFVVCGWIEGGKIKFEIDDGTTEAMFDDGTIYDAAAGHWYVLGSDGIGHEHDEKNDDLLYRTLKRVLANISKETE